SALLARPSRSSGLRLARSTLAPGRTRTAFTRLERSGTALPVSGAGERVAVAGDLPGPAQVAGEVVVLHHPAAALGDGHALVAVLAHRVAPQRGPAARGDGHARAGVGRDLV